MVPNIIKRGLHPRMPILHRDVAPPQLSSPWQTSDMEVPLRLQAMLQVLQMAPEDHLHHLQVHLTKTWKGTGSHFMDPDNQVSVLI